MLRGIAQEVQSGRREWQRQDLEVISRPPWLSGQRSGTGQRDRGKPGRQIDSGEIEATLTGLGTIRKCRGRAGGGTARFAHDNAHPSPHCRWRRRRGPRPRHRRPFRREVNWWRSYHAGARSAHVFTPLRRRGYGGVVLIAVLLVAEWTVEKLAGHHISAEEVRQVSDGDRIVIRNPRPRVHGSVLMIGPTGGGRILTVVLNPDPLDEGAWHVRTAWPASDAQIGRYRRDR